MTASKIKKYIFIYICILLFMSGCRKPSEQEMPRNEYFFSDIEILPEYEIESNIYCSEIKAELSAKSDKAFLEVEEIKQLENGSLYKIQIIHEAGSLSDYYPPNEKWYCTEMMAQQEWNRLQLGYFYVTTDRIYLLRGIDLADQINKQEDIVSKGTVICQGEALDDKLPEEEKGWHEYIKIDGNDCIWHGYSNLTESGFYERFIWRKGKGLVRYYSGYGAGRDHLELTIRGN